MGTEIVMMSPQDKRPVTLKPSSFLELGVQERRDLEEWIKANPDILGMELLILTSEYDEFENSDKRLDLLGIDREGKLVVVELKRDATGSLADLQSIRYAAFCSTMTFEGSVDLYAKFSGVSKELARQKIQDFVEDPSFCTLDNKPRIILAAGSFDDQELTSTVLWLRSFGVDISCVEITPYRMPSDGQIILVPRVIIPLPEAEKYLVQAEKKEAAEDRSSISEQMYKERNRQILTYFHAHAPGKGPRAPWGGRVMQVPTRHVGIHFEWLFHGRGQNRILDVALHLETASRDLNRRLCSFLEESVLLLEKNIGEVITVKPDWTPRWSALFAQRACEPWGDNIARWAADKMLKFIEAAEPLLDAYFTKEQPV